MIPQRCILPPIEVSLEHILGIAGEVDAAKWVHTVDLHVCGWGFSNRDFTLPHCITLRKLLFISCESNGQKLSNILVYHFTFISAVSIIIPNQHLRDCQ